VPQKKRVLIFPVFTTRPVIEKYKMVDVQFYGGIEDVLDVHLYSVPFHILETGSTVSLDVTSESLAESLEKFVHREERTVSRKIVVAKLYNFKPEKNRVVSWGNVEIKEVDENIDIIHRANIQNILLFFPSIYADGGLWAPLRWFVLESSGAYRYSAVYTYNVFLAYIDYKSMDDIKKIRIYMGKPLDVYAVHAKAVTFGSDGYVYVRYVDLHFLNHPHPLLMEIGKGYQVCFTETFNGYRISHPERSYRGNINLVNVIYPVTYSLYDIVPLLSPYYTDGLWGKNLIEFKVPSASVNRIIRRLEKFGGKQSREMIDEYDAMFEKSNRLLRIRRKGNVIEVKMVNPALVSHLIRMCCTESESMIGKYAAEMLESSGQKLMKKLLEAEGKSSKYSMMVAFSGAKERVDMMQRNADRYLSIHQRICGSRDRKSGFSGHLRSSRQPPPR